MQKQLTLALYSLHLPTLQNIFERQKQQKSAPMLITPLLENIFISDFRHVLATAKSRITINLILSQVFLFSDSC